MAFGPDDPKVNHARDIATACAEVTDANRCEAASKIYECSIAAAQKLGIKMEELL